MAVDEAEVDGVGCHKHACAKAGEVVGLDGGQVKTCLCYLRGRKRGPWMGQYFKTCFYNLKGRKNWPWKGL